MESILGPALLILIISFILFLLLRELMCWYWKINKILSVLESIDSKLTPSSKIASKVNEGKTSDTQAGDINVESIDYSKYYLIQCPNCDNKEIVEKKEFKNPTVYKKFSAEIGGLMFPMKFSCNKCKKNFKL